MTNLDVTVNLDINPSYHVAIGSNNNGDVISEHEYDDATNNNHVTEANSLYMDIVEGTAKLYCENLAYVGLKD